MTERSEGIDLRRLVRVPTAPARKPKLNRKKSPPGYKCRLGPGIGHGHYASTIVTECGFRWSPTTNDREDMLRQAWAHYDALHPNNSAEARGRSTTQQEKNNG